MIPENLTFLRFREKTHDTLIAILILVLISGLSVGKASAQQSHAFPRLVLGMMNTIGGTLVWYVVGVDDFSFYSGDGDEIYTDSATDDLSLIIDPDDCPSAMGDVPFLKCGGQEGEDPVDLWFELLYVGYTEDEAFEM